MKINVYSWCCVCEEVVYRHKTYTDRRSDFFFNKHRAIVKNGRTYCLDCYRQLHRAKPTSFTSFSSHQTRVYSVTGKN
ncbi:Hypothetical protein Trvi_ORF36 [Trabala vishnou gigantina nucleopolyhedrovirus]|uniref:Hypothetical protein n=1 Tax=Trabala vishnou gigantina nucleopolyhedrovirus TaxID=2863583 RepID=UPI002481D2E0|nr:Hypothetical protein QKU87_gp036 [Trabala vishnou gigantina nucleopolyhedrovirus]QYC92787.1 Hypothetical protein Trvi_ORF36 [Trabala vishnou gigantina nucleopolyhedrovirus]